MVVLHPFQCLAIANNGSFERDPILFAACGPKIYSTTLNTGEHVSQWPEDASEPVSVLGGPSVVSLLTWGPPEFAWCSEAKSFVAKWSCGE